MTLRRVAAALSVAVAAGSAACSTPSSGSRDSCDRRGAATVCLRSQGGAYSLSGEGFRSGSELAVDVATGAGQIVVVGGDGRVPEGAAPVGFLPGTAPEEHVIEGVDRDGRQVQFRVRCWVDEGKQGVCEL